ncbi:hypothetical protein DL768_002064 [Monosporascus sp. mg162]|nr:hypothetical protein DL768_002064 [Monosporascus sp. mg162]
MPRLLASLMLAASLASSPVAWAAKVGYFESNGCVDRSGMEKCHQEADEAWTDCINENCRDQNIDCHNDELDTCGTHGEEIAGQLTSTDELQVFGQACMCCAESAYLSTFWEVCPSTDPSLLGADEIYQSLVVQDENWPQCTEYMEAFPCASTLGFTPPGGDDSGTFYEPGNFPPNGTATTSNIASSITSPVSGATYTWTYNSIPRTVTVVSGDAKPTATGEAGGDAADSEGQNQSQDGGQSEVAGNGDNEEDKSGSPSLITPGFFLVGGPLLLSAIMML